MNLLECFEHEAQKNDIPSIMYRSTRSAKNVSEAFENLTRTIGRYSMAVEIPKTKIGDVA